MGCGNSWRAEHNPAPPSFFAPLSLLCHFPTSLLRALPDPFATHRDSTLQNRRWVVAVAHEITDNPNASNAERTGRERVILEQRITE